MLHASAVVVPRGAIAFVGVTGQGKSTLSGSFVTQGFPLLTDDCLLLQEEGEHLFGHPSYPGLRLWPDSVAGVFGQGTRLCHVAHYTEKKRLGPDNGPLPFCADPAPLQRVYVLAPYEETEDTKAITLAPLSPREAFMELVKNTYRLDIIAQRRLNEEFERVARVVGLAAPLPPGLSTRPLAPPHRPGGDPSESQRTMNSAAIAVQNLTKTFPARKGLKTLLQHPLRPSGIEVLRNISLEVRPGEVLGLLGPNGAGKTTLLEILSTLLLPTSGRAWVCGYEVVNQAAQVRKVVGYCPSASQSFYPRLTGVGNLEFFAVLNDFRPREAKEKIGMVLDLVGMDGASNAPFQWYSEGMKQRLSLARALLTDPPVLLLDEPTKSLDPLLQGEVRRFLRTTLVEKLGKTVLLVTHSLAEAEEVCDRLAIIYRGKSLSVGTPEEVREAFGGGDLAAALERAVGAER